MCSSYSGVEIVTGTKELWFARGQFPPRSIDGPYQDPGGGWGCPGSCQSKVVWTMAISIEPYIHVYEVHQWDCEETYFQSSLICDLTTHPLHSTIYTIALLLVLGVPLVSAFSASSCISSRNWRFRLPRSSWALEAAEPVHCSDHRISAKLRNLPVR